MAELGIKEGWLKVREGRKLDDEQQEALDRLFDLEDEARDAKRGMWATDAKVRDHKGTNPRVLIRWHVGNSQSFVRI